MHHAEQMYIELSAQDMLRICSGTQTSNALKLTKRHSRNGLVKFPNAFAGCCFLDIVLATYVLKEVRMT